MQHLIPDWQDDQTAADDWRHVRWPDGGTCPRGGSEAVEPRERCAHGLQRLHCVPCATRLGQPGVMGTAWTGALCEESPWRPLDWLLVLGVWPWQLPAPDLAAAAALPERTAPRCLQLRDGGLSETDHLAPSRPLAHPVEADEGSQRAGRKGRPRAGARRARAPRHRGLQRRGRATAALGRPPRLGLGPRRDQSAPAAPAAPVSLAGLEHVRTATLPPLIAAKVQGGAPVFPAADHISHCTAADSAQRTRTHGAGAYARRAPDGVCGHGNTMEGRGSGLRHCLDHCRGMRPRGLHLRVARDEFLHHHGHWPGRQAFAAALRCSVSTTGDDGRRMAPQHRRMPLTLCYR